MQRLLLCLLLFSSVCFTEDIVHTDDILFRNSLRIAGKDSQLEKGIEFYENADETNPYGRWDGDGLELFSTTEDTLSYHMSGFKLSNSDKKTTLGTGGCTIDNGTSKTTVVREGNRDPRLILRTNIIETKELFVTQDEWADYVFDENYELMPLANVKSYITEHKHLPNIPSAKEVKENGVDLSEMQALLLSKVEELTLHLINMEKNISQLESK